MVVITTFLTSCSTDDTLVSENSKEAFKLKVENGDNDIAIVALNEITEEYILRYGTSDKPVEDIAEYVLEIAKSNGRFMVLQGSENILCNKEDINMAITLPKLYVQDLNVSTEASNNIIALLDKLDQANEEPQRLVDDFSVTVAENQNIIQSEKDIMLMASDLILSNNKNGLDNDWKRTSGVMAASVSGGLESPAQAVINAVVVTAITM